MDRTSTRDSPLLTRDAEQSTGPCSSPRRNHAHARPSSGTVLISSATAAAAAPPSADACPADRPSCPSRASRQRLHPLGSLDLLALRLWRAEEDDWIGGRHCDASLRREAGHGLGAPHVRFDRGLGRLRSARPTSYSLNTDHIFPGLYASRAPFWGSAPPPLSVSLLLSPFPLAYLSFPLLSSPRTEKDTLRRPSARISTSSEGSRHRASASPASLVSLRPLSAGISYGRRDISHHLYEVTRPWLCVTRSTCSAEERAPPTPTTSTSLTPVRLSSFLLLQPSFSSPCDRYLSMEPSCRSHPSVSAPSPS